MDNIDNVELTNVLNLDFSKLKKVFENPNAENLIPVAVQNSDTLEVILIAYTNERAFKEAIKRRKAIFWSSSRNELWFKGADSGNTFTLKSIHVNCEQNSLVYKVVPDKGGICHVSVNGGTNNCFYRKLNMDTGKMEIE